MPIVPIVGKLRRKLIADLSIAMGLGVSCGYLYWYSVHIPAMKKRDDFYLKYEAKKLAGGV
ncbi:MAG: hypothetical protein TREMPRED_000436 [Tremellales sp. Tagirdzhanova-0007]|nr:MAG: hypothetical protein TREMPRED_000436 [Tremellales sp. Tagirdzhanova-0007]